MMWLRAAVIGCMLWSSCVAIPMWRYYDDTPAYHKRQADRYRSVDPRQGRQGYDDWRENSRDYRYNNAARGYEDLGEERRWQDGGYDQMDGWEDNDAIWPDSQPAYEPLPDEVTFSKAARTLQKWRREEERKRENRYAADPDAFYIQVDDNGDDWRKESMDQGDVEDIFNGRPSDSSRRYEEEWRSRDGLDPLQNIGVRLMDLTKQLEDEKEAAAKNDAKVKVYIDRDENEPDEKSLPISAGKAKSLLKSLEDEEKARESEPNDNQSKEPLDKAEVEAMLNKRSEEKKDSDEEDSLPTEEYDLVPSDKNRANKEFSKDDLQEAERQLLKEENEMLIEALQKAPMELVRSPFTRQQLKALIEGAETRQQLVDHIDSQLAKVDDRR